MKKIELNKAFPHKKKNRNKNKNQTLTFFSDLHILVFKQVCTGTRKKAQIHQWCYLLDLQTDMLDSISSLNTKV